MYTSIFLDLDNTLLDFNKAESTAVRTVLRERDLPCDDSSVKIYSDINRSFWERFEAGEIEKNEIFTGRFEKLLEVFGRKADVDKLSKDYCSKLADGFFTIDGVFSVLDYLRQKGYKLYATTNGLSSTQYKRIKGSGLEPYFDGIFVSEDAGHQKPEKEYFDYVISQINEKNKSRLLIVGDSQSSDILGGINSGIDTCWYNPNKDKGKYYSKFEINDIDYLKEIL